MWEKKYTHKTAYEEYGKWPALTDFSTYAAVGWNLIGSVNWFF